MKTAADYRLLPYRRKVWPEADEDGQRPFVAMVDEIPWIKAHGSTREEALLRLDEIFDDCVQAMLDAGDEVPEPTRWPAIYGGNARVDGDGAPSVNYEAPEDVPPWGTVEVDEKRLASIG